MKRSLIFGLMLWVVAAPALADIPKTINYQGRLLDAANQPVADGQHTVMFKLYDAENAVNSIWYEERDITTQEGYFNSLLGSVSALNQDIFNKPLWLGIKMKGEDEMSPRQPLAATPYAMTVADGSITQEKAPSLLQMDDENLRLEYGYVDFYLGNTSVNEATSFYKNVTFKKAFSQIPVVICSQGPSNSMWYVTCARDITVNGFTYLVGATVTTSHYGMHKFSYIAIGPK